jgi:hypothetical protein
MLADETNSVTDSKTVETAAGIGFGLAVSQGTNDRGVILGGTAFVGITRADPTIGRADVSPALTLDSYPQNDNAAVLAMGDIWVIPDNAVTAGEAVYYSTTTGKLGHSGGTVIEDARWMTGAAAGALALLRLGNIAGNR